MARLFPGQLFDLGQIVITKAASIHVSPEDVWLAIQRHARGDWGELCEEDRLENELSVTEGFRLLSAYHDRNQTKLWIITEADRSSTGLPPEK